MSSKRVKYINLTIDGKQIRIPDGLTVLQAAQKSGIYIPTLCYLENLAPYGGCRLCMVEIKKMRGFPTACTTPATADMVIKTKTPEIQKLRREILELTLSEHPYTCLVCKENHECPEYMYTTRKVNITTGCNFCTSNGDCELQDLVNYLEIKEVDFPIDYRAVPVIKDNPFYEIDYNLCVLCGRCVRICNEERNSGVLAFVQRGNSTLVGTAFDESQKDAGCEFCGACVDVCPTGSLSEKMGRWVNQPDRSTETSCIFCGEGCTMNVNTHGNRIINVGPEPGGRTNPIQLCVRGKFVAGDIVHHPDRIKTPMIRKKGKWIEVSWEEAISFIAANLERYRGNQFGMIGSAQMPMEENYLLQKFTRKVMRSNNTDLFNSYRNRGLLAGIHNYYLSKAPGGINQIAEADTIIMIGTNASVSHPMVENRIRKASRNGTSVIFANSDSNRTSEFATHQISYKPGLLRIFLDILLKEIRDSSITSSGKVKTGNNQKFQKTLKETGISEVEFRAIVKSLKQSEKPLIILGDLRGADGQEAIQTLFSLEKELTGNGVLDTLFLLDEGNRYGSTYAGMHPDLLPGFDDLHDPETRDQWSEKWGVVLSEIRGLSCREMIGNIRDDGITSIFVTGDIPVHPDLEKLKFFIQQNLFLTEASAYAHAFLPVTAFPEMSGHILTLDRKLKKLNQVIQPEEGVKHVRDILVDIARQMQENGFEYEDSREIFEEIESYTDLSFAGQGREKTDGKETGEPVADLAEELTYMNFTGNNGYFIMGNCIGSFIPDMKEIRNE